MAGIRWQTCRKPFPLREKKNVSHHRAYRLTRQIDMPCSIWPSVPTGKTIAAPAGTATGNPGVFSCPNLMRAGDAVSRRPSGVIAAIGHHMAGWRRQRNPLGVQASVCPYAGNGIAGVISCSGTEWVCVPSSEPEPLSDGDRIGQDDTLAVRNLYRIGNPLGRRPSGIIPIVGQRVNTWRQRLPLGVESGIGKNGTK